MTTGGKCHWWEVTHPGPGRHAYGMAGLGRRSGTAEPWEVGGSCAAAAA